MRSLEITGPSNIICRAGGFRHIAEEAAGLGKRAVIVTGARLHGSDQVEGLVRDLENHGVQSSVADPITGEPTVEMVDDLAAFARAHRADVIIAIGGGSVLDCAKGAAVMATNDGITEDYQLKRREIANTPLPQVAVPTTAGTGSEATRVSVLTNNAAGVKRSIQHPLMTPNVVILDPELTVGLPKYLTTVTAMDALSHAIESAVSTNSTAYTRHIALAGIEELADGLPRCQSNPEDLDARLGCLMGACFAGLAMQQGMGASHSLAPAVCIVSGARHSEAIAALLPHSIRLNLRTAPNAYDDVKRAMACVDVAGRLEELCQAGGFQCSLTPLGLSKSDWPRVYEVMSRYAGHRKTNPAEVTDAYAEELFLSTVES